MSGKLGTDAVSAKMLAMLYVRQLFTDVISTKMLAMLCVRQIRH
jgi:hypothetical protein